MTFNTLKKAFISNVIFHYYNPNHKIIIKTDVSDYVSEDILSQYNKDGVLHLIIYFSKKHNSAECNYKIYNKEFIIIIHAFKEWHSKLKSFISSVKVIIDYKNLKYFISIKQLSYHQAHWNKFLSCFNYHITYCPDKAENKSDPLIHQSNNLSKKKNTSDSHHLYQH